MVQGTDISTFKKGYSERNEGNFPETFTITLKKQYDLKYGENMHQHAAMYLIDLINGNNVSIISKLTNIRYVRDDDKGKGGLSLTNNMDISRGMDTIKYFPELAVAILKHNTISGFAKQTNPNQTIGDLFRLARDADLESNFGGTVIFNRSLDRETAELLYELRGESPFFVDVLAAPGYEEGVIGYLQSMSKNLRIAEFGDTDILPKFVGDNTYGLLSFKEMPTGRIGVQDLFLTRIKSKKDFIINPLVYDKNKNPHVVENAPTDKQLDDLLTAWYVNCSGARSNGVVFVNNGVTVAVGGGQVARVYAVKDAIEKGMQKAMDRENIPYNKLMGIIGYGKLSKNPFQDSACASDAFFPFADSLDLFTFVNVGAICHAFGSERDHEVVDRANQYKLPMVATLERCFGHF